MNISSVKVDLAFPVIGAREVFIDHGHALYGAIKQACPGIQTTKSLGIHPLRGRPLPEGRLYLGERGILRLRLPIEAIPLAVPLAGRTIEVVQARLTLGAPSIHLLLPSSALWARTVTMRFEDPSHEAAEQQLRTHLDQDYPDVSFQIRRPHTIRIHGKQVLGFEVLAEGLSDEDSMRLQNEGYGGRRAFGCGIFVRVGENARPRVVMG